MNKYTLLVAGIMMLAACKTSKEITSSELNSDSIIIKQYANTINTTDVKKHVFTLASDEFEGRKTGEKGQKLAAKYLADQYQEFGLTGNPTTNDYYQVVPVEALNNKSAFASENVIGFIEGTERPEEIVVITSHYDHEGIKNGYIYNGADDNASGTSAVLEIAEAFAEAKKNGHGPKRSLLFINFTGEEKGLLGSKYFAESSLFPLENMVAGLNIDMIGRVSTEKEGKSDYIYVIGADRLSSELHTINEEANKAYANLDLDYTYNAEDDKNRYYYRSDHYNFAKNNIPVIFYFNGVHEDYHQPTDTAEKIDLKLLTKRAQLIFYTAWELANRDNRIIVDKGIEEDLVQNTED
ncbi:M28 family metallopeptidase [Urechidicola vernalis]|uniref:M28 family metallopeptidase n=1 Tax=Urechidicola vernalis TaxID=3075600 RepID=A0ABU2Y6Q8_9FLAO|nr:M28 family metallopeptidase [Urechidicola sp. P050]MDT0553880.1 M28 family metallopeptidase [Urechidicola sp. P050]